VAGTANAVHIVQYTHTAIGKVDVSTVLYLLKPLKVVDNLRLFMGVAAVMRLEK
jgi:hypothetical protein